MNGQGSADPIGAKNSRVSDDVLSKRDEKERETGFTASSCATFDSSADFAFS